MSSAIAIPRPQASGALLICIVLGGMLVPLNSSMIAVALPQIMKDFGASVGAAGWLVTAYLITMATLQSVAGKLGDQLGRRGWLMGGVTYFGIASLLSGMSPNLPLLLFLLVQQAIAGALIVTNGLAVMFEAVPVDRRAGTLGMVSAAVTLAAVGGPALGGFLTGLGGWRAIFWVNIPLVLATLAFGWAAIPRDRPGVGKPHFDLLGAALFAVVLILGVGLVSGYTRLRWPEAALGGLSVLGLGTVFVRYEIRQAAPMLDLRLFKRRSFSSAMGAIALGNLAMCVTLLALPILLADRAGWTSAQTGLLLAVMSAATALLSPLGGHLADRVGRRLPSVAGLAIMAASMLPLAWVGSGATVPLLFVCLAVAGSGSGLSGAVLQTAAMESVESDQTGLAIGISSTSGYLGSIVGSSLLSRLLDSAHPATGYHMVFLIIALAACGAASMSLGIPSFQWNQTRR